MLPSHHMHVLYSMSSTTTATSFFFFLSASSVNENNIHVGDYFIYESEYYNSYHAKKILLCNCPPLKLTILLPPLSSWGQYPSTNLYTWVCETSIYYCSIPELYSLHLYAYKTTHSKGIFHYKISDGKHIGKIMDRKWSNI